jgi:uncharacterized protein YceK
MKTLCLLLMMGLSLSGCSSGPKMSKSERAYYKYIKRAQVVHQKDKSRLTAQQRTEMRSLKTPPPSEQQITASTVDPAQSDSQ